MGEVVEAAIIFSYGNLRSGHLDQALSLLGSCACSQPGSDSEQLFHRGKHFRSHQSKSGRKEGGKGANPTGRLTLVVHSDEAREHVRVHREEAKDSSQDVVAMLVRHDQT